MSTAVSSFFAPIFIQAHTLTFCIWLFLRIIETVEAHSGYRLPFSPWQFFDCVQGGAERHDFHHSNFTGSFGSFFCFWDWLCGTDVPYRAHQLGQVNIDSCSKYWHPRRIFLLCPIILWILCSCFCSSRFCNFCCRLLVVQVQQQEFAVFPFFLTAATVNTGLLSRI